MSNNLFPNDPIFVPLIDDTRVLNCDNRPDAFCIEAGTIKWRPGVIKKVQREIPFTIIDPSTGRIPFEYSRTDSFNKLPYAIDQQDINKVYSDPTFRLEDLVKPCIDFQLEHGASVVIPPYFHFTDTNSQTFVSNIGLITDSVINLESRGINKPVLAVINLSVNTLTNHLHLSHVITSYLGELGEYLEGFIIQVDDLDDRKVDEYTLESLAELIHELSRDKTVILQPSGYSEILTITGLNAFIGGIARRERFSLHDFDDPDKERRGRDSEWTYVPELFNYRQNTELRKVGYTCDCAACDGTIPEGAEDTKVHFLYKKLESVAELQGLSKPEKADLLRRKIIEGQHFARNLKNNAIVYNDSYLSRWLSVIEKIKDRVYRDDDTSIDDLLSAIDEEMGYDD